MLYHGALSLRFVLLGLISNVRLIAGQFEYLEEQIGTILLGMFERWNLVLSFLFASILLLLMAILVAIPATRKKCGFLKFVFFLPALVLALSNLLQFFLIVLDVLYSVLILNASISLTELIEALPMCVCCDIFYFAAVLLMGLWLAHGASRKNKKV